MRSDSPIKTLIVALVLALVCSILVSGAAVLLRPVQDDNKKNERKKNVLRAAGIYDSSKNIDELYKQIKTEFVDIENGVFVKEGNIDTYFSRFNTISKSPATSISLSNDIDIAGIASIPKNMPVFMLRDGDNIKRLILPVHGSGLWSTMRGFLCLESDLNTVCGITFYSHAETPGLGGEIENPKWQKTWVGKKLYGTDGKPNFSIVKGGIDMQSPAAVHKVDSLSGASITSRGVQNLILFWIGDNGFKKFIDNLKNGAES